MQQACRGRTELSVSSDMQTSSYWFNFLTKKGAIWNVFLGPGGIVLYNLTLYNIVFYCST